jgi:hypothetical protein
MKFRYVSPKAVNNIVGQYAPVSSFLLARIIEEALDNTNLGYVHTEAGVGRLRSDPPEVSAALVGIADKLLAHNTSRTRRCFWDLYGELDFDLVHESNPKTMRNGGRLNTSVKAYFFHTEFSRPPEDRRVVFHLNHNEIDGTLWSISFPVQIVMKGFPWIEDNHFGYCHGIAFREADGRVRDQHNYIGITKRSWLKRMSEHFREIQSGSSKAFHSAWRQCAGNSNVYLTSELITSNHTFDQIMAWEEWAVDEQMAAGTSLNMIPGGFKGMKFLHEHRITRAPLITIDEREEAVKRYQALNPRVGIPNLLISQLWNDPEYAEKVICRAEGRLSADQVRRIRELNDVGIPIEKIAEIVSARNSLQVERVLKGATYSRIQ